MKKENYLLLTCMRKERASVVQILATLSIKTLREFNKGYRGPNDKLISNFHYNYCHRTEEFQLICVRLIPLCQPFGMSDT